MKTFGLAALMVLGTAGAALSDPPAVAPVDLAGPPADLPLVKPEWISRPSGDNFAAFIPKKALAKGVPVTHALIGCRLLKTGYLSDCWVLTEDPPGMGVGVASAQLTRFFRAPPRDTEGWVQLPITFRLPTD